MTLSSWCQHSLFYNYAFQTLAIDALSRNCYLKDSDVILCQPDEELEAVFEAV